MGLYGRPATATFVNMVASARVAYTFVSAGAVVATVTAYPKCHMHPITQQGVNQYKHREYFSALMQCIAPDREWVAVKRSGVCPAVSG